MKLDCLLVNPSALSQIYQSLSNELAAIEPPIWAGLLANHLRSKGKVVDILDCEGEGLTVDQSVKKIGDYKPRLIAIVVYGQQPSASTQNMYAASILCSALKEAYPEVRILLLGGHVSALPERTLREEAVDFVCKGEGAHSIMGLLSLDNLEDSSKYKLIPGLWWREGDQIVSGASATVIPQNLLPSELPGIAWDLLPMANYRAHNWHCFGQINDRKPYASLYTSLGCPFRCSFCCINAPFGKSSFRYWSPDFMINEFEKLAKDYGVKNVKIADEMFVLKKDHFLKLSELLIERNYGLNIWAYARIDTVKLEYLDTMKKAGINWLALGIESGSKFVRDGVSKGRFDGTDIAAVVRQIKEAGINVIGNYIFGLPDDDFSTMQETLELAIELNCEMSNFYSAMAYPGSQLYDLALMKQWDLPQSWLGFSQHSVDCLPLRTEMLTAGEVLGFRDWAFYQFFENPKYLRLVKERFGYETYQHIVDMCSHKLRRKFSKPYSPEKIKHQEKQT